MAKALLGHRVTTEDGLLREAAHLRVRVRDLTVLLERLQSENDALRAEILLSAVRHPEVAGFGAPTIER